ncbi:MAG: PAS domain S-box protein, partial [Betaproteobacteria bacterium]
LTGPTLQSGAYVVSNDFLNDPATAPWHAAAARAGVRAAAKFPIRQGGAVIGAISLYAAETGFFSTDLIATLEETAEDVSFALDNFARETARRQAAAMLDQSEQRYRSVIQSSIDGFWIMDAQGHFLDVNDAYCHLLGYEREEILKMRIQDIEASESPQETARHIGRVMTQGYDRFETRHRCKDGQLLDVEVSTNFRSGHDGECFYAFLRDITARKQADAALRAAEEQFRGLVEQSIAGTYIVQDDRLAYANRRFAEILGYASAEELIGRDPLSFAVESDRATVAENVRRRIEGEARTVSYSFTALRKDGSTTEVGVHGAAASHQGRPAVIGLIQDISEKKRAEEQIQRYIAQLERAFMRTVEVATTLSEMRDPYTAGHERRVTEIAVAIGTELGFDAQRLEGLRVAGYLHDIGKITIPAEILSKPGKLNPIEFQLIQQHAQAGYDVLKDVGFPWPVAEMVLQHHERLDGSGYPNGLKDDAIGLEARILAVADTVEAMASHRPYRPGLGIDKALAEIERGRGSAYDAAVVDACLTLFRDKAYSIPV